jgi:CTP-dependent riboflavin kinase
MAKDGDRHQLGDPISRIADDETLVDSALQDVTDPARLTDQELRRQLANLDEIVREATLRGTPAEVRQKAELRLRQLYVEYRRRAAAIA